MARTVDSDMTREPTATGWTGWVAFGGCMMVLVGVFHAIEGLVAIFDNGYYVVTSNGLIVDVDYTVWGWVHLVMGIVAVIVGAGLFTGNMAARVAGVIIAGLSAVVSLGFIAAYPFWSIVVIALDVIVIYAIVAHGKEMRAT